MAKISPLQVAFYKGMGGKFGAVQFNLQKPHYYCPKCKTKMFDRIFPPAVCTAEDCNYGSGDKEKIKSRDGAIFVEICSARGKNDYNWDNKIIISLSAHEMGEVLVFLEGAQKGDSMSIQHDPGAGRADQGKTMKYFNLSTPNGLKDCKDSDGKLVRGGCFLQISEVQSGNKDKTEHRVPLNAAEVKQLAVLMRAAIPVAYGWV